MNLLVRKCALGEGNVFFSWTLGYRVQVKTNQTVNKRFLQKCVKINEYCRA